MKDNNCNSYNTNNNSCLKGNNCNSDNTNDKSCLKGNICNSDNTNDKSCLKANICNSDNTNDKSCLKGNICNSDNINNDGCLKNNNCNSDNDGCLKNNDCNSDNDEIFYDNIIIGAGPAGLQLAYILQKNNLNYIMLEKEQSCASFFDKFPHTKTLISINKPNTGNDNPEYNMRHDWNTLLNDEGHMFKDYSQKFYPNSTDLVNYMNDFNKKNKFNIEFGKNVLKINKNKEFYTIITDNNEILNKTTSNTMFDNKHSHCKTYKCKKLFIATGMSKPNIPKQFDNNNRNFLHYGEYEKDYFMKQENLDNFKGKRLLLFGGGNSSYELANHLVSYAGSILILGSYQDYSIVSHYAGNLRSIYYPFLDTFYLKSLNAIDVVDANIKNKIMIKEVTKNNILTSNNNNNNNLKSNPDNNKLTSNKNNNDNLTSNQNNNNNLISTQNNNNNLTKQFELSIDGQGLYYKNKNINYFDNVILCSGWKFDNYIFNFPIDLTINDKYPKITCGYESTNNDNLYFIGSITHSLDYKKSSGGFIHGFRYTIKMMTSIIFDLPFVKFNFRFDGTMKCYKELANHISYRINNSSSLYQMFGLMCDLFYFDETTKNIVYVQDLSILYVLEKYNHTTTKFCLIQLAYGEKMYDLRKIGSFDKYNPRFIHPEIIIFNKNDKNKFHMVDKIMLEEDLFSDFTSEEFYDKILRTLKGCPLII